MQKVAIQCAPRPKLCTLKEQIFLTFYKPVYVTFLDLEFLYIVLELVYRGPKTYKAQIFFQLHPQFSLFFEF